MEYCNHPTCYESEETCTIYEEPTDHNDKGWIAVCGKHVDLSKDGVTVHMSDHSGIVDVANAEILQALENDEDKLRANLS